MFRCKECLRPARLVGEFIERECGHYTAGVLADMEAVAYGENRTEVKVDHRLSLFRLIIDKLRSVVTRR